MLLYPLQFKPIYKQRIWGGNKLKTLLNKAYKGNNIGESWEISNVPGNETKVLYGHLKGYTLSKIAQLYGVKLLGQTVYNKFGTVFPLLIKFIDAKTPLSIQVHPHNDIAKTRHNSFGKNEMWYIMDADENAEIIVGFKKEIDKKIYSNALNNGTILELLNTENTKIGDVFYIPTGRLHAIGSGVLLAEIQQTSDITYRIYDYNRFDKTTGKTRELHNDLALDVIDFKVYDSYKTNYSKAINTNNTLVHSPYFRTNILYIEGVLERNYNDIDSFVIYICTAGSAELNIEKSSYAISKGQCILLPAILKELKLVAKDKAELLEVYC